MSIEISHCYLSDSGGSIGNPGDGSGVVAKSGSGSYSGGSIADL